MTSFKRESMFEAEGNICWSRKISGLSLRSKFPYDHPRFYCPSSCPNDLSFSDDVLTTVQTNLCIEFCAKRMYRVMASKAYVPAGQDTDWRIPRSDPGASFSSQSCAPRASSNTNAAPQTMIEEDDDSNEEYCGGAGWEGLIWCLANDGWEERSELNMVSLARSQPTYAFAHPHFFRCIAAV